MSRNPMLVKLGTVLKTGEDFLLALFNNKIKADDVIRSIIKYFIVTNIERQQRELVYLSPAELGFKDTVKRVDFFKRAQKQGYKLCNLEIILQFVLQHFAVISKNELCLFAMDPIYSVQDGNSHIIGYYCDLNGELIVVHHYASIVEDASICEAFHVNHPWIFCK